jgi:hypothetical protein
VVLLAKYGPLWEKLPASILGHTFSGKVPSHGGAPWGGVVFVWPKRMDVCGARRGVWCEGGRGWLWQCSGDSVSMWGIG